MAFRVDSDKNPLVFVTVKPEFIFDLVARYLLIETSLKAITIKLKSEWRLETL